MVGTFTESTLLDVVSDDGGAGFMVRIARHVDEGVAWLWLVAFGPDGVYGFVEDQLPCNSSRTPDDGSRARYEVNIPGTHGLIGWITRTGSASRIDGGKCGIEVNGHRTPDVPRGAGSTKMALSASFSPLFGAAGSNLPGRTESIVRVEADIEIGENSYSVSGLGQFHEQLQDAPRFDTPFTYVSLRAPDTALVAIRGPRAGGGVLLDRSTGRAFAGFRISEHDPQASSATRSFECGPSEAESPVAEGIVVPTVNYSVPILGGRRPSAVVTGTLNGARASGFVNDWIPPSSDAHRS
jgi:hypothetical protein